MSLKKVTSTLKPFYRDLEYEGQIQLVFLNNKRVVDFYSNDITFLGLKAIFENLGGFANHKLTGVKLGMMPNVDNCDQWPNATKLEDLGAEIKIESERLRSTEIRMGIDSNYSYASFTVSFAIFKDEDNGKKFNCMGLYMDDDKLFSLARFAELTKVEDINIIVQWKLTFKSERLSPTALSIIAQNMLSDNQSLDTVELWNNGGLVGYGDISISMQEPVLTNVDPATGDAGDKFYIYDELSLSAVIEDSAITEVDKIIIKSGDKVFDNVELEGWSFSNIQDQVRNALVYKIKIWELTKCKEMLLL